MLIGKRTNVTNLPVVSLQSVQKQKVVFVDLARFTWFAFHEIRKKDDLVPFEWFERETLEYYPYVNKTY